MKYFIFLCIFLNSCHQENIIKDIDGNSYNTIQIGKTIWLKENLRTTHYQNGDPISHLKPLDKWINTKKGAYCFYNHNDSLEKIYGKLYNWYAVSDERNICPIGFKVASYHDFISLDSSFGGMAISGKALISKGNKYWEEDGDNEATNESGFTALPAGHRNERNFGRINGTAFFWNKENHFFDIDYDCCAHECSLRSGESFFLQDWGDKFRGMSVRCVKNGFQQADSIKYFQYTIIDKHKQQILKYGNFEMIYSKKEWLVWDKQLKLIYRFDTLGIDKIDTSLYEFTGWRKNKKEFFIHPPRSYDLKVLQYAPFPYVNFDKTITFWKDTLIIPKNSGWGNELDNSTFFQEYKVIQNNEFNYKVEASSIMNYDTSYLRYQYNYKDGFVVFEYDILDSLIIRVSLK